MERKTMLIFIGIGVAFLLLVFVFMCVGNKSPSRQEMLESEPKPEPKEEDPFAGSTAMVDDPAPDFVEETTSLIDESQGEHHISNSMPSTLIKTRNAKRHQIHGVDSGRLSSNRQPGDEELYSLPVQRV